MSDTTINWRELDLTTDEDQRLLNVEIEKRLGIPGASGDHPIRLPTHYCNNLNAAIQLKHEGWDLQITRFNDVWEGGFGVVDNPAWKGNKKYHLQHKSLAILICLSWLEVSDVL